MTKQKEQKKLSIWVEVLIYLLIFSAIDILAIIFITLIDLTWDFEPIAVAYNWSGK